MNVFLVDPKLFAVGQSVTWMCGTTKGSIVPVAVRVVNVVNDRVVIRIVKQPEGAVYFKVVGLQQVRMLATSDECYPEW